MSDLQNERQLRRLAVLDRGESAVRVLLAVAELNRHSDDPAEQISTVVVHSEAQENAWYAREADAVLVIGPQLYAGEPDGRRRSHHLDVDALVGMLTDAGVDSVWLGHSVVGDHCRLAQACEAAGLVVAGPAADTVALIEDRVAFRRTVAAAGLPLLAWSDGPVDDLAAATAAADQIGYPVRLLAGGGSGRRGITRVPSSAQLGELFAAARERALAECGDPTLLVEADPGPASRVEVIALADDKGVVWTLDVRDTSLRRNRQRVVLESPSPAVSPAMSEALRAAAVDVCRAIGYHNAGAIRFVIDPDGERFYVTGVDARLQLEHPLTEEMCGVDMVALRLKLAAGGTLDAEPPLPIGHAIEVRLLAQDPLAGFTTSPGRIALLELPAGAGVRVDSGVRVGDVVSQEYEPLLATLTAWGRDRTEALTRLRRAVERTSVVITGTGATDRSFLLRVLDAAPVRDGRAVDSFLDDFVAAGGHIPEPDPIAVVAAAIEAYDEDAALAQAAFLARAARGRPTTPEQVGTGVLLNYRGDAYRLRVDRTGPSTYRVAFRSSAAANSAPGSVDVQVERVNQYERRLTCAGRRYRTQTTSDGATICVDVDGAAHELTRADGIVVRAGWPAFVVSLSVGAGDEVHAGDLIAVLESMKMETAVHSPVNGIVTAIEVTANAQVDSGAPLLRVKTTLDADLPPTPTPAGAVDLSSLASSAAAGVGAPGHETSAPCESIYAALRSYLLGYDLDPATVKSLLAQQRALSTSCAPDDAALLRCEDALLDLFADLGALSRPTTSAPEADLVSGNTQEYLIAYLQWLDPDRAGLGEAYRERLARALGRYGVTSLRRTPELEAAAVRLFTSLSRLPALTPVVASILQRRLDEREVLASLASPGLRRRFDRLAAAAQGRQQVVADLARDVRFRYVDEPVVENIYAEVAAQTAAHLAALRENPQRADREEHVAALVECPQPLRGALLHAWLDGADSAFRHAVLEVYARRFYRIRALSPMQLLAVNGMLLGVAEYPLEERAVHLVVAYLPLAELPQLSGAIASHLADVPRDREVVVDVVAWRPG